MKSFYLLFFLCFSIAIVKAQTIYSEDFEASTDLPAGWSIDTKSSDGGWLIGRPQALSSEFFEFISSGSTNLIGTNDDQCNCDKSNEYLITPPIDPGANDKLFLSFDLYFSNGQNAGIQEQATVEFSYDLENWIVLETLHGHAREWDKHLIDLSEQLTGEPFYIGFNYTDNGGWLFGMGIDNVSIEVPKPTDILLAETNFIKFAEVGVTVPIEATIVNNGSLPLNEINLIYEISGPSSSTQSQTFEALDLKPLEVTTLIMDQAWMPTEVGEYEISVRIEVEGDVTTNNNEINLDAEVYPLVVAPDKIEDILKTTPKIEIQPQISASLNLPTDLDFFPILAKDELWIVNQRTENQGGSTTRIQGATQGLNSVLPQVDGNAWHFMSLPTAIAFSNDNFNFATSPGVRDANHNGGTFTGPTLWSSDPEIYAQPSGGNGSHLDMLHGSPFSMGIAHEKDNVFWVFDNFHKDIVRYDFVDDHGPGNDDHSDALVYRYEDLGINGAFDLPNHMVLDKEAGQLYIVDNGNGRILKLDINSSTSQRTLALINEPLAEHKSIGGYTFEVIIDEGFLFPVGIELFNGKLLVSDYGNGDVIVYDTQDNYSEMGRFASSPGICGIKVGPDGNIWAVNRLENTLSVISEGDPVSTADIKEQEFQVFPNPTSDYLYLRATGFDLQEASLDLLTMEGKVMKQFSMYNKRLDIKDVPVGSYILRISDSSNVETIKISKF